MRIVILAIGVLCLSAVEATKKAKKPADVTVMESKARRSEGKILVDGRVQVTALKKMRGLVIVFDMLSAENEVMASEKARVERSWIEPGEERSIRAETSELARAVRFRIRAFDGGERELRIGDVPRPLPIE